MCRRLVAFVMTAWLAECMSSRFFLLFVHCWNKILSLCFLFLSFLQNSRELITKWVPSLKWTFSHEDSFNIRLVYCAFLLWCLLRVTEASHCLPPESLEPAAERLTEYRYNFSRQERALRSISFHKGDISILLEWRKSISTCGCKSSKSATENRGCEDFLINRTYKTDIHM